MRSRLRFSVPDCTSDKPLMKSTGKTHGIRLRMSPPRKARAAARKRLGAAVLPALAGPEEPGPPEFFEAVATVWGDRGSDGAAFALAGGPAGTTSSYARPPESV